MTYNGNQLIKAEDTIGLISLAESADFKNYSNVATEYTYNKNGAMTKDLNKGISQIQYNSLNLPTLLDIKNRDGEGRNEYTYSAAGVKLQVKRRWNPAHSTSPVIGSAINVNTLTQTETTDYAGNIIYEDDGLKRVLVDGGYIENGKYHYYLKDHLGNNRIVIDQYNNQIQSTQYYPFGMTMAESTGQSAQPYKYNDKELDKMHGLNWYDYSARHVMPDLGRFTTVDPLAEKYYSISPYAYCNNNPIKFIDPTGMYFWIYYKDDEGNVQKHNFDPNTEYTGDNTFIKNIYESYNYLKEKGVNMEMFDTFIGNENVSIDVKESKESSFTVNFNYEAIDPNFPSTSRKDEQSVGTVYWNPSIGLKYKNDKKQKGALSPSMILLHEVGHGFEVSKDGGKSIRWDMRVKAGEWTNVAKRNNIWNNEEPALKVLGIPVRSSHSGGKSYKTSGVNSTLTPKEAKKLLKNK